MIDVAFVCMTYYSAIRRKSGDAFFGGFYRGLAAPPDASTSLRVAL